MRPRCCNSKGREKGGRMSVAHWPAWVAKDIANSGSAPVKGIKSTAYKEDTTNVLPTYVHTLPTLPPRLLWHLPRQNQTDYAGGLAQGWSPGLEPPPVMAAGWIPCLESFSRLWAPWIVLLNSEIGEKTRHSPSSGESVPHRVGIAPVPWRLVFPSVQWAQGG